MTASAISAGFQSGFGRNRRQSTAAAAVEITRLYGNGVGFTSSATMPARQKPASGASDSRDTSSRQFQWRAVNTAAKTIAKTSTGHSVTNTRSVGHGLNRCTSLTTAAARSFVLPEKIVHVPDSR